MAYLQETLPDLWMALGIDTFIDSLPARMTGGASGIQFHDGGLIGIGADFSRLETAWMRGVAAMARAGAKIIVDDGFLSGPPGQQRWRDALTGLAVVWVVSIALPRRRPCVRRPAGTGSLAWPSSRH